MPRSINPGVWEQWRKRLRRFESSGLTVAAYCQSEDVSTAAFYQWRKKLHVDSCSGRATRSAFVPVVATSAASAVVLTLVNGVRVELPAHDHGLVQHVIQAAASLTGDDS